MYTIKKLFAKAICTTAVVILTAVGILSWVFYRPKARCPGCGRLMRKSTDESFGVWICPRCN